MKKLLPIVFMFIYSFTFSQITLSETHQNVSCYGMCNGSTTVSVSGGAAPYSYTWTPFVSGASNVNSLCAGVYTVTVMDAVANSSSLVVTITEPAIVTTTLTTTNPSCNGVCNGTGSVAFSGGAGLTTFLWEPGLESGNSPNSLCAGNHTVTITSNGMCTTLLTFTLSEPPPLTAVTSATTASCGQANGQICASVSGGAGALSYQWSNGPFTLCNNYILAGAYTFTVTDANGCTANATGLVNDIGNGSLTNATITTTIFNETCYLTGDGAIDLSITGSNPGPFTYIWSNGATTQDITNIVSNTYWVTITDGSSNCMTIQDTVNAIGTNCGTILGNVFIDNNSDCIKNGGDNNYNGSSIIVNPGNRFAYTNANGDYTVNNLPYGTYSVSLVNNSGAVFPTCTTTLNTTVNAGNPNSITNNLCVGFNSVIQPDLQVSAWNQGIVPGFVCRMNYQLNNLNNVNASGVYKVTLPSSFIPNITNVFPGAYTLSGDTIIWNFNNVTYTGSTQYFYIDFTTPLSTPLGSTFISCVSAQPNVTDLNTANNNYCYQRTVTGSYDPNDKSSSPAGVGPQGYILAVETDLTYLIRFQNTGNGPAVNIMVQDTLSPNVDVKTFQMLTSSHNCKIDILQGNVLRWKFNNIMLPDSNSNEPASHGYIQYLVKRTSNNTPGTQIKNTAYIYFDFNAPVVTNTTLYTIETVTGIKSPSSNENEWNVYPNPSTGTLYMVNRSSFKETSHIQVLNSVGQTVYEETVAGNYKNIDLSKLNNGIYFVKIVSDKQRVIKRVVLSK